MAYLKDTSRSQQKFCHYQIDPIGDLTDREFQEKYKLTKESVIDLSSKLNREGWTAPSQHWDSKSAVLTVCILSICFSFSNSHNCCYSEEIV